MGSLFQDLRFALKTLAKSPAFALIALVAIALGIGANTAIFSLVNAILLRPIPVESPGRLMWVFNGTDRTAGGVSSYPDFVDYKTHNTAFSDMLAYGGIALTLASAGETEIVAGAIVTGNYFDMLGVKPAIGRGFLPDEDRTPMTHPVVILQHSFWTQRFGANPEIIGRTITLNGRSFTVVGVAPPGFTGLEAIYDIQLFVPMMMQELVRPPRGNFAGGDARLLDKRGQRWLTMIGRLKPGVTPEQAQADVSGIAKQLEADYMQTNAGLLATVGSASQGRPEVRRTLIPLASLLMAVVGAVLLIACANVANLMLVRVSVRRREIAIRLSIGASRVRLVRQLLTESILISVAGGAAGLTISVWLIRLALSLGPVRTLLPVRLDVTPDWRVLAFTLALSAVTGVFFGLVPALRSFRFDVVADLKQESPAAKHGRRFNFRNGLVVGQLAISLVLLIGAGLFLRSFMAAQSVDLGVDTAKLITMPMNINLLGYNRQQSTEFYRQAIERVEALPGVESASMARVLMLSGNNRTYVYFPEGMQPGPNARGIPISANVVGLKFFKTLGTPIVHGRDFNEQDRENAPAVVIVNEAMARKEWPGQDATGKQLRFGLNRPPAEVIGVVRDAKYLNVQEESRPYIYLPLLQNFETGMTLHVRTASNPEAMIGSIRAAVQSLDRNLPLADVRTMEQNVSTSLLPARLGVFLIAVFAGLALLLAAIGAYGVMSYTVAQRTREIGIRMALGARRRDVMRLVIGQGMVLSVAGAVIGIAGSMALTRFVQSMLFAVSPTDPLTFGIVTMILIGVAGIASYIPARRAAGVDPMAAVRQE
jgi:predicted permease